MTSRQRKAQQDWAKAYTDYRNAERGERDRTRRALKDAATEVLKADIAAKRSSVTRRAA